MATVTPSKVAASALQNMDINTPKKSAEPNLMAKLKAAAAAEADGAAPVKKVVIQEPKLTDAELRKRFVGDIHCEQEDEPILKESNDRFVLFPIRYREVRVICRWP